MEGRCIFVFFMIFNALMGLIGLAFLGGGIALLVTDKIIIAPTGLITTQQIFIAMIVIGVYVTTLLILGACSWKKTGVVIAYFVLTLFLLIAELVFVILIAVDLKKFPSFDIRDPMSIGMIFYAVSLGISFLSFLFSTIYFCVMKKDSEPQLYSEVRNMEYTNMPSYQNV